MGSITPKNDIGSIAIEPYDMHVSAKYLELTKKKLEFTRLPHELLLPEGQKWEHGTPKSVLEPLVDFWLDAYDWRAEESHYNTHLPQYRTTIQLPNSKHPPLRIHFVHKRCQLGDITPPHTSTATIIPLLFCHDYPSSFLDISQIIDGLTHTLVEADGSTDGPTTPTTPQAGKGAGATKPRKEAVVFHVVAPSIPGSGFSDASTEDGFGLAETADVFDTLMARLGYDRYVAFGSGWGFAICRSLALRHGPSRCVAIHTANPASFFPTPSLRKTPLAWLRYRIARMTRARFPGLSFGYVPSDFDDTSGRAVKVVDEESAVGTYSTHSQSPFAINNEGSESMGMVQLLQRQTAAYALCDSPVGLLAYTLDVLRPCLSSSATHASVWSPSLLLNWTMMQWLPGPEAGLRWFRRARLEAADSPSSGSTSIGSESHKKEGIIWKTYSSVPLGISQFGRLRGVGGEDRGLLGWAEAWQKVGWVKRRDAEGAETARPEWERPAELVADLKEGFGEAWTANDS